MPVWRLVHAPRVAPYFLAGATALWINNRTGLRYNDSPVTSTKNDRFAGKEKSATPNNQPVPSDAGDGDHMSLFEDDDQAAWNDFSTRFTEVKTSLASVQWASLGDRLADHVIPEWAQTLPGYVAKLQAEMEMNPGSLADDMWHEAQDISINPEVGINAKVRIGKDLCPDEKAFIRRRKQWTTKALAKYLNIPENDIDPRDVPTIAICGSGGGLRALVAGASSYLSAQKSGLLECCTYSAGVSGSCWLQSLYNSSIGKCNYQHVIDHLKKRIGTHIAYPPAFLELMTRAPTNKYILSGTLEKLKGDPKADFGLVDIYGILLGTRLMIPRDELSVDPQDLKLSAQRQYIQDGRNPMPIYSAVRHEIPVEEKAAENKSREIAKLKAKKEAWFQWFEFSPYEFWCEELQAGIPSWSVGRHFKAGETQVRDNGLGLPELRLPFMMGIWGSAFCATLAHYYKEIRPVMKGLAGFGGIDDMIEQKNDELVKLHPIDPGGIPNFALGLRGLLPQSCPESMFKDPYLELMDAGMSNNLPIYPLLRPERNVDIIVCFDASADIRDENWVSVAGEYARQHGIKGWPAEAGWPKKIKDKVQEKSIDESPTEGQKQPKTDTKHQPPSAEAAEALTPPIDDSLSSPSTKSSSPSSSSDDNEWGDDLGYCNIWVGHPSISDTVAAAASAPSAHLSSQQSQKTITHRIHPPLPHSPTQKPSSPPQSRPQSSEATHPLLSSNAGTTLIYFPLLPNPSVPGVDPDKSPYLSTWNFIYTPEQIDSVVALAEANFRSGEQMTKEAVRAVYERKRRDRIAGEKRGLGGWRILQGSV